MRTHCLSSLQKSIKIRTELNSGNLKLLSLKSSKKYEIKEIERIMAEFVKAYQK
jgi:hypothetical protein